MRASAIYALVAAQLAAAHSTVQNILVNDVDQGHHTGIRTPTNGNNPIKDVTSADMTCNVGGTTAAADTIEVKSGDKITFQWHHNDPESSGDADEPIAASHKGPIMVYIAPTSSNGAGDVWVKLYEDGLKDGTWAVDTFIANKGQHSITLPDLEAGEYLLRPEILALHEAYNVGGVQAYMECVQIKVTSSGSVSLPAGVAIPGTYSATDPGIKVNIYPTPSEYTIPGPAVWNGASGSGSGSGSTPASSKAASSAAPASSAPTASTSIVPEVVATSAAASSAPAVSAPAATSKPAAAQPTTLVTSVKPAPTGSSSSTGAVQKYGRCGGKNYTGATTCADGWTCKAWNDWYSQCVESA